MVVVNSKTSAGLVGIVLGVIVGIVVGVLIGRGSGEDSGEDDVIAMYRKNQWLEDGGEDASMSSSGRSSSDIINMVNTDNIDKNIKELTREPHLAGTERDEELARFIRRRFEDEDFDSVQMPAMNFLLSRPNSDNPNLIRIYDGSDNVQFTSNYKEVPLHPGDENKKFVHAFNAYTPAGDVTSVRGEAVVYVNYGRIEDFQRLENLGLNISGKIALLRYGKIFRGNKVSHAAKYGAVAAIIYSDPEDVARDGQSEKDVYPYTTWLPGTGMQRGTTFLGDGDPLTPGWPSIDDAYRVTKDKANLPTIPAQPIGYADAKQILMRLGGPEAPADWQGNIKDVKYNLGPQFLPEYSDNKLKITSNNFEAVVKSYNVIGIIYGSVEPDRYVLIGNHRDAWGYGASDPSSGTAQLLETARVLGEMKKNGWRPRRTLIFCSWGSEEYGLIGSTEWVEEHIDKLQGRAVTYINTDTCASGLHVQMKSSPLLFDVLKKIAGMVPGVIDSSQTILDEWMKNDKKIDKSAESYPIMKTLGSGSDYASFTFYAGIPAMDIWFRKDQSSHKATYASYHTGYETYFMISNNTDPGFKAIQGCGRIALLFLKYMSDSVVIPFTLTHFPRLMADALNKFETEGTAVKFRRIYSNYDALNKGVRKLQEATEKYHMEIKDAEGSLNPIEIRRINDQLMKFERIFILPTGLPGRPVTRHAIFASSQFDSYATAAFPGLSDLLHEYEELDGEEKEKRDEQIRLHVNDLVIMMHRAHGLLKSPTSF